MSSRRIQQLPTNVHLWSPEDFGSFLAGKGLHEASDAALKSVRLHSFDELDGPRVLRDGAAGLQALGVPPPLAAELITEMSALRPSDGLCPEALPSDSARVPAALWGVFIADALAAPVHWYYDLDALKRDYGEIEGYVAPLPVHSGNRIMNNHWRDDKHSVQALVLGEHILHGKAQVWAEPYNHYHHGYAAGENTLNAQVARVALRALKVGSGEYSTQEFLQNYKQLMTTPGGHNDSYAEAYHRQFFANHLLNGVPLGPQCAGAENHDTPSIGGFVSALPVLLVAGLSSAIAHLRLTHDSDRLASNLRVYAQAMQSASEGCWPQNLREAAAAGAKELGWDLGALAAHAEQHQMSDAEVVMRVLGPACYIGNSLPVVFYLAHQYSSDARAEDPAQAFKAAVLANANAGGENCHRGSALGALFGMAVGLDGIPVEMLSGLSAGDEIRAEIEAAMELTQGAAADARL